MLVLSRRVDEVVDFPALGISVRVLRLSNQRVRLGIVAPKATRVLRGELVGAEDDSAEYPTNDQIGGKIRRCLGDASEILARLQRVSLNKGHETGEEFVLPLFEILQNIDKQVSVLTGGAELPIRQPKHALIVDDNCNEQTLLASYLRMNQIDVTTACNGAEAIRCMEYLRPDVVVLDMNMPRYDGPWTVDQLRSNPVYEGLQIFALSGMDPCESPIEIGPSGVDRWFTKPLNPEHLIKQIVAGSDEMVQIAT